MDSNNPFFQLSRNHCLGPASGAQQIVSRKNQKWWYTWYPIGISAIHGNVALSCTFCFSPLRASYVNTANQSWQWIGGQSKWWKSYGLICSNHVCWERNLFRSWFYIMWFLDLTLLNMLKLSYWKNKSWWIVEQFRWSSTSLQAASCVLEEHLPRGSHSWSDVQCVSDTSVFNIQ